MKKRVVTALMILSLCIGSIGTAAPVLAAKKTASKNTVLNNGGVVLSYTNAQSSVGKNNNTDTIESYPNDGAAIWAKSELILAFQNNLILNEMIGNWQQPTNRLVAAEAVVRLLEALTGKSMSEIAAENEYDLTDCFQDTINDYANFLKQSGISNGVDGHRFVPNSVFTRAQLVTMLGRMVKMFLDIDTAAFPKGSSLFSDTPAWADEFVGWAGATGITDGIGDGRFNSNGTLQNQHLGMFIWRTFSLYYKSAYQLLRTGNYITVEQMDLLKAESISWQSAIAIEGDFAEIVAIEPSNGTEQQIYVAFRRFDHDTMALVVDNDGYERMQTQKPDGVQARIIAAYSGSGSGEFYVGIGFISNETKRIEIRDGVFSFNRFTIEESERIELFYATSGFGENEDWENVTIHQIETVQMLSELPLEERQFN